MNTIQTITIYAINSTPGTVHSYKGQKRMAERLQAEVNPRLKITTLRVTKRNILDLYNNVKGCQCTDRPGETKVWCCNICGLPCESNWLETKKPMKPLPV